MAKSQPARSVKEIEAELTATRERMARTVDELAGRVSPQALKADAVATIKRSVDAAMYDESGGFRYDRLVLVLGSVSGTALALGLLRRTFYQG